MSVENESDNTGVKPKTKVTVVPWYNAAQFKKVYECLFSDKIEKIKWAHDTISVWKTRCYPSLPTGIEATYALTGAIIQDILFVNKSSLNSYDVMQGCYSAAIIKFVNMTVEVNKNPIFHQTLAQTAQGLGIPSHVIDARNDAAHGTTPIVPVLRHAAHAALKYLKESYWDKEVLLVKNYTKKPRDDVELTNLFYRYINIQLRIICNSLNHEDENEGSDKEDDENISNLRTEFLQVLRKIKSWVKNDRKFFVKVLVSDGIFIPTEDDVKSLLTDVELADFKDDKSEDGSDNFIEIPKVHESLWYHVIAVLHAFDAIPMFLESLLKSQGDRTIVGQKLITAWAVKLLRIADGLYDPGSKLKRIFKKKGTIMYYRSLFYSALSNPCKYTPYILPWIIINLDLDKNIVLRIMNLLAIFLGQIQEPDFELPKNKIFTVEDLKQMRELQKAKEAERKGKPPEESIWTICKDDCIKKWPIGLIVNTVEDEENEEQQQLEEDFLEDFLEKTDITERMLPSNKNDNNGEERLHVERPLLIKKDFEEGLIMEKNKRKSFLYKK